MDAGFHYNAFTYDVQRRTVFVLFLSVFGQRNEGNQMDQTMKGERF